MRVPVFLAASLVPSHKASRTFALAALKLPGVRAKDPQRLHTGIVLLNVTWSSVKATLRGPKSVLGVALPRLNSPGYHSPNFSNLSYPQPNRSSLHDPWEVWTKLPQCTGCNSCRLHNEEATVTN